MLPRSKKKPWFNMFYAVLVLGLGTGTGFIGREVLYPPVSLPEDGVIIDTCFGPEEDCEQFIVDTIDQLAHESIYMAAYSFTSQKIGDALLRATERGVKVCLFVDQGRYNSQKALQIDRLNGKIASVKIDKRSSYAHQKMLVIDRKTFTTGSYNFGEGKEKNYVENVVRTQNDTANAEKCLDDWLKNNNKCLTIEEYKKQRSQKKRRGPRFSKKNKTR